MAARERGDDPLAVLRRLEQGPLPRVCLLFGEEDYLVDAGLRLVLERLGARRNASKLRAGEDRLIARLEEALRTRPLFGGEPCAVLTNVDALREAEREDVLRILQDDWSGHLVLVGRTPDLRRRLYSRCVREGWSFGFRRLPAARFPAWLVAEAKSRGHSITPDAVQQFVDLVGTELRVAANEIEKVSLYVGMRRPIDAGTVAEVVGGTRARSVLELSAAIEHRDVGGALGLIRRLLEQGESPIGLTAFLAAQLRRMLLAKSLLAGRTAPQGVASHLGVSPWVAERIMNGARRYDAVTLTHGLVRMVSLDVALKSSRQQPHVLLETFLLGLDGRSTGKVTAGATLAPGC